MLETIKYINHINEEIEFGKIGLYVNNNDLHDYSWEYESINNKVSYFNKNIQTKTLPIVVADNKNGVDSVNKLMECTEKDVLAQQTGRLIVGDYYLKCYVVASKKTNYSLHKGYMNIELALVTEYPMWIKEIKNNFSVPESSSGKNLDFAFDFPYDFTSPSNINELNNLGFADTDFVLNIYGEVTNPVINIGGNSYGINGYIASGEYLTINSKNKTIVLNRQNGTKENMFKNRNKDNYIFQKIPSGQNSVSWSGNFTFDVILLEERSEPKWI